MKVMTEVPKVGELYETQKSHVVGVVVEVVPNPTGSYRLRLVTPQLEMRWTTFVPEAIDEESGKVLPPAGIWCFECRSQLYRDEFTLVCLVCD